MRAFRCVKRFSWHQANLLLVASVAVLRVRIYLIRNSHEDLRALIESYSVLQCSNTAPNSALTEVAWSVRATARLVPGATCLTQASAGQLLLARRGYASTVRLSLPLHSAATGTLAPHAWLLSGNTIVLGGTSEDYIHHRPLHDFPMPAAAAK